MKLKRSSMIRAAIATVSALALSGGIAAEAIPAHASEIDTLIVCDFISNKTIGNVAVDAWVGQQQVDKAFDGQCAGVAMIASNPLTVQLFLDNLGVQIDQVQYFSPETIKVTFTGTINDVHTSTQIS
jgi:hypothetical protein